MPDAKPETNIVSWVVDGKRYDVDLHDIDGVEWRDITKATGLLQVSVMSQALIAKEFDSIGALLWIWRRRSEPDLTFEDVLKGLTYRSLTDQEGAKADPPV